MRSRFEIRYSVLVTCLVFGCALEEDAPLRRSAAAPRPILGANVAGHAGITNSGNSGLSGTAGAHSSAAGSAGTTPPASLAGSAGTTPPASLAGSAGATPPASLAGSAGLADAAGGLAGRGAATGNVDGGVPTAGATGGLGGVGNTAAGTTSVAGSNSLGLDRSRPVLEFLPVPELAPYAVSWGDLRVRFSETVAIPDWIDDSSHVFGLVDAADPSRVTPVEHAPTMWTAVRFVSPGDVLGTQQRLFLKTSLYDAFGNPATVDPSPIRILEDSLLTDRFDFDDFVPLGLAGTARYVAPGAPDAPCESGGCVVIGPVAPCAQGDAASFLSMRIRTEDHVSLKLRVGLYADAPQSTGVGPVVLDSLEYINAQFAEGQSLGPSTLPDALLPYFSGFFEATIATQSAKARGAALAFGCDGGTATLHQALVIESIELVHDGGF